MGLRTAALALAMLFTAALHAGAGQENVKGKAKPSAKSARSLTCPITLKPASKQFAAKLGAQPVYFCCNKCKAAFAKMPKQQQMARIKTAAEKNRHAAPKVSLVEVNTCPIMGGPSDGAPGGFTVVGKYKVNYCCGSCKGRFESLSADEQMAKIQAALKK